MNDDLPDFVVHRLYLLDGLLLVLLDLGQVLVELGVLVTGHHLLLPQLGDLNFELALCPLEPLDLQLKGLHPLFQLGCGVRRVG